VLYGTFARSNWRYIRELFDCDDFGQATHAVIAVMVATIRTFVRDLVDTGVLPEAQARMWWVGECWGTRFRGRPTGHAIAGGIMRPDEGDGPPEFVLFEPQSRTWQAWTADSEQDRVHFARLL